MIITNKEVWIYYLVIQLGLLYNFVYDNNKREIKYL